NWNADEQIPGRGEDAAAADIGATVEVRRSREVCFDPEDPRTHEPETGAPIEPLRVNAVRELLPRIATKVHPPKRNDPAVSVRDARRQYSEHKTQYDDSSQRHAISSGTCIPAAPSIVPLSASISRSTAESGCVR